MMDVLGPALAAYCRALPKVELHAHIHGSIRPSTLAQVLQDEAQRNGTQPLQLPRNRSLEECFEMFGLIHQVVVSRRVLRRIVIEAVEDFAAENVKYLELRSTPRDLPQDGATRADYVDEVVSALDECRARKDLDIEVRLLLSINRNQSLLLAEDTVDMALERKNKQNCPFIVGIDLSGNSERPESEFSASSTCWSEHELAASSWQCTSPSTSTTTSPTGSSASGRTAWAMPAAYQSRCTPRCWRCGSPWRSV